MVAKQMWPKKHYQWQWYRCKTCEDENVLSWIWANKAWKNKYCKNCGTEWSEAGKEDDGHENTDLDDCNADDDNKQGSNTEFMGQIMAELCKPGNLAACQEKLAQKYKALQDEEAARKQQQAETGKAVLEPLQLKRLAAAIHQATVDLKHSQDRILKLEGQMDEEKAKYVQLQCDLQELERQKDEDQQKRQVQKAAEVPTDQSTLFEGLDKVKDPQVAKQAQDFNAKLTEMQSFFKDYAKQQQVIQGQIDENLRKPPEWAKTKEAQVW